MSERLFSEEVKRVEDLIDDLELSFASAIHSARHKIRDLDRFQSPDDPLDECGEAQQEMLKEEYLKLSVTIHLLSEKTESRVVAICSRLKKGGHSGDGQEPV